MDLIVIYLSPLVPVCKVELNPPLGTLQNLSPPLLRGI